MRYADSHCSYTETAEGYTFTGPCMITGKPHSVFIPGPELFAYRQGRLIQDAMPSVSVADREFLMSGYSPEGWGQVFGSGEEGDDEEN